MNVLPYLLKFKKNYEKFFNRSSTFLSNPFI